jgi:hypothetical protein
MTNEKFSMTDFQFRPGALVAACRAASSHLRAFLSAMAASATADALCLSLCQAGSSMMLAKNHTFLKILSNIC